NTEDNNVILLSETARFDALLFSGIKPYQFVGADVSTAGDFNGDGVSDIMIGGPGNLQPEGYCYIVFGSAGETASATYRAYIAPGDAQRRGIGDLGMGRASSPESRFWIDYDSGHDGLGSASLQTVTIHRHSDQVINLRNTAKVLWQTSGNRIEWNSARVMVKYVSREVEGLREEDLVLYHALSP